MNPKPAISDQYYIDKAKQLLKNAGLSYNDMPQIVAPDGSNRKFWRFPGVIAVAPETTGTKAMTEAVATWKIGEHLFSRGCAIPQIYGFDRESGLLLMEDAGSISLYDRVLHLKESGDSAAIIELYSQVLAALVDLQLCGKENFDIRWCWESACYDRELMLEKESGYFLSAWWQDFLGQEIPPGIMEELEQLAERAAQVPAAFFLHRDCQSRNIFFQGDTLKFIDFQGGRLGALAYDLSSLLMDPYVGLSEGMQESLFMRYIELLKKSGEDIDKKEFRFWYEDIALHRNLQIIGAFAFLSRQRKKPFFAQFIKPSVIMLRQRLAAPQFSQFSLLKKMAEYTP